MAFNGSGTFSRPVSSYIFDTVVSETDVNSEMDGIATGLSTAICKDGQTTTTARIPFASGIYSDTIAELTSATGVTVDGALLKDGRIDTTQGADIASASTVNLETATGNVVDVTGTTTITAITLSQGHWRWVRFTGILTLTHGSSLVLPGAANITTAAGDYALFIGYASSVVRCAKYVQAAGLPLVDPMTTRGDIIVRNSSNATARLAIGSANTVLKSDGTDVSWGSVASSLLDSDNLALAASVGSSALTIAIKGWDGNDPSASNAVKIRFRSATAATGTPVERSITGATSLVISNGSTMGFTSAKAGKLWIVAFDDAGTVRIGAINCLSGTTIYGLGRFPIASSTAEGGSGGADSAQVFYTGTAVTSKAYTILGYMSWETGLTTAGTWDATPTRIQLYGPNVPLPGAEIQRQRNVVSTMSTGTTALPADNSIPQSGEGDQYMTQAITPTSAANLLDIEAVAVVASSTGNAGGIALFQDSTADALAAVSYLLGGSQSGSWPLHHQMRADTTSSTTFKIRIGLNSSGTVTFNGISGSQYYGGVMASFLQAREIMA